MTVDLGELFRRTSKLGDTCALNRDSLATFVEKCEDAIGHLESARACVRDGYALIVARRDDTHEMTRDLNELAGEEFTETIGIFIRVTEVYTDTLSASEMMTRLTTTAIDTIQANMAYVNEAINHLATAVENLKGYTAP